MSIRAVIVVAALLLLFPPSGPVSGQQLDPNNKRGFEPSKLYHFSGIDSVSTFSGNLNLRVPIGQEYVVRPGFSYQFMLSYNSKIWDFYTERTLDGTLRQSKTENASNAGLGWLLSIGQIIFPTAETPYSYLSPDGGVHEFRGTLRSGVTAEQGVYYTQDGSYLRMMHTPRTAAPGQAIQMDVETPDGLVHTFNSAGELTSIRDRYDNWVEVTRSGLTWTFTEGRGTGAARQVTRTHSIEFENAPPGYYTEANLKRRVKTVRLAAFGNDTATYAFHYVDRLTPRSTCTFGAPAVERNVPLLASVGLPDGSSYQMTYDPAGSPCWAGVITRLDLPTKGAIAWLHGAYSMARDQCIADERYTGGDLWSDPYPGVSERTLLGHDGAILEQTKYNPALVESEIGEIVCDKVTYFEVLPPKVFKNSITSRSGVKTVNYYSAFRPQEPRYAVPDASPDEYGLAFTRSETHDGHPLSTQTFSATGVHLRSTYAEYETDGFASSSQINPRQSLGRTVFLDDDGDADLDLGGIDTEAKRCKDALGAVTQCWVQQASTDFDGFGHYRRQETTSNYPGSTTRSTFTNYNPGTTSASNWPSTKGWILGTYTGSAVTENGVTLASSATFDTAGSLVSTQTGSGIGALLTASCRGAYGFITSQRWFGGDGRTPPSAPCSTTRGPGEAILTHQYTFTNGAVTTHTAVWDGTPHRVIDETLDANTGLASSTRDGAGLETTYSYDGASRLTSMKPPGLAATTYTYANASVSGTALLPAAVEVTTASSNATLGSMRTQYQFDAAGRMWREKALMPDDSWTVRETTYNTDGQKAAVSEAEKLVIAAGGTEFDFRPVKKTRYEGYDAFGRAGRIIGPDTYTTLLTYRGARVTTRSMDVAMNFGTNRTRVSATERTDAHGRLTSVTEGDLTTTYDYHASGKLASVSMPGEEMVQTRTFRYDGRGLLTSETHPEIGAPGNGTITYSSFDARGQARRKQIGGASAFDLTFEYDPAGRLTGVKKTSSSSYIKQFQFDEAGRLSATARYNESAQLGSIAVTEAWQYEAATGLPERRDTAIGSSAGFATPRSFAHYQLYDDLGMVREIGYPFRTSPDETARTLQYTYRNGLLTGVTGWISSISYQPNGTIATVTHNGGVTETWTSDPNGMPRPKAITVSRSGTALWASGDYAYDGTGNIAAIGERRYRYDRLGRLAAWRDVPAAGAYREESFTYDPFGNKTEATVIGCEAELRCYTTSVLSRKVSGTTNRYEDATYDAAGSVVTDAARTFTYDAVNMPAVVAAGGRTFVYLYTADDERVAAVERFANGTNQTTSTLRGFGNQLLSVRNGDTWKEDQIWRGSSLAGFLTPSGKRHYGLDHLGSPRVITTDTGTLLGTQTFTPFGEGGASDSGALQFTGHERDRANLGGGVVDLPDYAHARLLDTKAGRFLSVDPGDSEKLSAPQTWNRYVYANNNPLKFLDPNGKAAASFTGFIGGNPSSAMVTLSNALDAAGDVGKSRPFDSENYRDAAAFLITEYKRNPSQPIVLLGHSWGGDAAVRTAAILSDNNVPVDLLITFDAVGKWSNVGRAGTGSELAVTPNVQLAINYYQTTDHLGNNRLVPQGQDSVIQQIFNIEVPGTTHEGIDEHMLKDILSVITTIF